MIIFDTSSPTPPHLREITNWIIDIGLLIIELLDYLLKQVIFTRQLESQCGPGTAIHKDKRTYVLTNGDHSMGVYVPFSLSEDSDP